MEENHVPKRKRVMFKQEEIIDLNASENNEDNNNNNNINSNSNNNNNTTNSDSEVSEVEEVAASVSISGALKKSMNSFMGISEQIKNEIKKLEEKERHWEMMEKKMAEQAELAPKKIILDVGGTRFATTKDTLLAQEGTFFHAMLASGQWKPGDDGMYFIDRSGTYMTLILDFLRMRTVDCSKFNPQELEQLKEDLDFYQIKDFPLPKERSSSSATRLKGDLFDNAIIARCLNYVHAKKLLYKATVDGLSRASFMRKCEGRGPTITFIKAGGVNTIFGGYMPVSWTNEAHKVAPGAFLFLKKLGSGTTTVCLLKYGSMAFTNPQVAGELIMCFGNADMRVYDGALSFQHAFPTSFSDPTGVAHTFAGTSFPIVEIEVYFVQ